MTAIAPLKKPASNDDLADYLEQVHQCGERNHSEMMTMIHSHTKSDETMFATITARLDAGTKEFNTIKKKQSATNNKLTRLVNSQAKVRTALGVDTAKKPVGVMSQPKFILTLLGITGGVGASLKFLEWLGPKAWIFLEQLNIYFLTGK